LGSGETAPPLTLRVPQVAEAEATLEAARAGRSRAQRDLARTEVAGPYEGRIRVKHVDIGQFVNRGTPVATVYAVDYAEVRLPLPDSQLAYVDLPLDYRDGSARLTGPEVVLLAEFAGETHRYSGHIVRTEGEIDPRSRMVTAVAQVADPYARGDERSRPPLAAGMFVEAEIIGREVEDVLRLPRAALRQDGTVLLVDDDRRLRFRTVQVLRATDSDILVTGGLSSGDRICLSPLSAVTDGMQVRIAGEDDPS
ncbi:MAG: efflux RND transporter periplasmic adaptor subunit, partial [Acidobacteriota bacterium]|nr:efflux RND transporter periplasmic adaptor subunit [Acidobacteriota bacterium]